MSDESSTKKLLTNEEIEILENDFDRLNKRKLHRNSLHFLFFFSLLYGLIHLDKAEEAPRRQFLQLVCRSKSNDLQFQVSFCSLGDSSLRRKNSRRKINISTSRDLRSSRSLAFIIRRICQRFVVFILKKLRSSFRLALSAYQAAFALETKWNQVNHRSKNLLIFIDRIF